MINTVIVEISGDQDKLKDRIKGIKKFIKQFPGIKLIIYASTYDISIDLIDLEEYQNIEIITINDKGIVFLNPKHSIYAAINKLCSMDDAAFVSAGNTGQIVSFAHAKLGLQDNYLPILTNTLPKIVGFAAFGDLGANLTLTPQSVVWTTLLLKSMTETLYGVPKIALLNIGEESCKGDKNTREIFDALRTKFGANFKGNIEFHEVVESDINCLVCCGKDGNLTIKTFAGTINLLYKSTKQGLLGSLQKLLFQILYKICWTKFDWRVYSGAYLLGVKKPILITHGRSRDLAIYNALVRATDPITEKIYNAQNKNAEIAELIKNI